MKEYDKSLQPEVHLKNIWKFGSYLKENTLGLHYIDKLPNIFSDNNRSVLGKSYDIHKYTLWAKSSAFTVKSGGTYGDHCRRFLLYRLKNSRVRNVGKFVDQKQIIRICTYTQFGESNRYIYWAAGWKIGFQCAAYTNNFVYATTVSRTSLGPISLDANRYPGAVSPDGYRCRVLNLFTDCLR